VLSRWPLTAFVIPLALGLGSAGISVAEELLDDPDVVIVMKDKYFHVIKGAQPGNPLPNPAFSLQVGRDLVILLRNEDEVAHDFVSPLLMKAEDLQISGRASLTPALISFISGAISMGRWLVTPCEGRSLCCMRNHHPSNRTSRLVRAYWQNRGSWRRDRDGR